MMADRSHSSVASCRGADRRCCQMPNKARQAHTRTRALQEPSKVSRRAITGDCVNAYASGWFTARAFALRPKKVLPAYVQVLVAGSIAQRV